MNEALLDPALLAALRDLDFPPRRRVRRAGRGSHSGTRCGGEEEFSQHRPYVPGDDLADIDWRATARTSHILVKERHDPATRPLVVVLDATASMDFATKLGAARTLAAALGILALRRSDRVDLHVLNERPLRLLARVKPGRRAVRALVAALHAVTPGGRAEIGKALLDAAPSFPRRGEVVVISDLYGDAGAMSSAARALARGGADVTLLHVLSTAELSLPPDTRALEDAETRKRTTVDLAAAEVHRQAMTAFRETLRRAAEEAGVDVVDVPPETPVIDVLRRWLRIRRNA